jgi:acyl transferase domain-containing protein
MTIALVFPGQGSQAVGMGKALAEAFAPARQVFDDVDAALGERLSDTIWSGPAETLTLTENAQPALMAVSIAALRVLEQEAGLDIGRDVAFVAGHSLGEYSALAAARAISLATRRACCAPVAAPCKKPFRSVSAPWRPLSGLSWRRRGRSPQKLRAPHARRLSIVDPLRLSP